MIFCFLFFFGLLMMKLVRIWFVKVDYSMVDCNVIVYRLKWHCRNINFVVENVSLIFYFLKCADMSRRNTSERPPKERTDRLSLGRVQLSTCSARMEKDVVRPHLAGRGRGGGTRLGRVDAVGGSFWRAFGPIIPCLIRCWLHGAGVGVHGSRV